MTAKQFTALAAAIADLNKLLAAIEKAKGKS